MVENIYDLGILAAGGKHGGASKVAIQYTDDLPILTSACWVVEPVRGA
jgi:hypothetical protein